MDGYSFGRTVAKAVQALLLAALAVIAANFAVPENLEPIFGMLPDSIEHALIPLIAGAFAALSNWLKNRSKGGDGK